MKRIISFPNLISMKQKPKPFAQRISEGKKKGVGAMEEQSLGSVETVGWHMVHITQYSLLKQRGEGQVLARLLEFEPGLALSSLMLLTSYFPGS